MAWQHGKFDGVQFTLAAFYALLACYSLLTIIASLLQYFHLQRWQKFFHPLTFSGCVIRVLYFTLQPFIRESVGSFHWMDNRLTLCLLTLPSFLFFCDYLIILFIWAELYHYRPDEVKIVKLRPIIYSIITVMFAIYILFFILDIAIYPKLHNPSQYSTNPIEQALLTYDASLYVCTSFGFLFYGKKIYSSFSYFASTAKRRRVLRRVAGLTSLIALCFVVRTALIVGMAFHGLNDQVWYYDGVYYFFLEWIPLVLMIVVLRRPTRKRRPNVGRSSSSSGSSGGVSPLAQSSLRTGQLPYLIYYPDEQQALEQEALGSKTGFIRPDRTTQSETDALVLNF